MTTFAPGWYPDPSAPGQQRYWNGTAWAEATAPLAAPAPIPSPPKPVFVSGLTEGQRLKWKIILWCSLGMAWPWYWWKVRMSRRRIG
ncbi:DUF2510 domain-containing protein [Isoptericola sp. b441]|uniref:DUF2510 domain-containing protein n=1 Tax=Actinotalea lenta TaxID=3064654 RepID=A0ABT9D823_9CELL|nr:DUF2510 domain-containing protein [Isoptericola sp. b441]MDO8107029.1 DUF2510 domain-containing protein [Isoptericola sp. b441]